jgi:hypothetical protein
MMEEGMLSIVRRGDTYQVRYASTNPYEMDRPLSQYPDEGTLVALLHHWGIDAWSIQQVIATVRGGGMAVLPIRFTAAQLQAAFPPELAPKGKGGQTHPPASGERHQTAERLRTARVSDTAERGSMTQRCTGCHLARAPLYQPRLDIDFPGIERLCEGWHWPCTSPTEER